MKKIAFYSNQLSIRGTEVALFQYAKYNEEVLGNKSIIMTLPNRDMGAYQKFADRFEVVIMEFYEYENYLKQNNFDYFYITKMGINDGYSLESIKTIVHTVFRFNEPHGHKYLFISDWLAKDQGYSPTTHSLPYICEPLPIVEDNLRNSLNIPLDAKVFGAYAGKTEFNINFVKEVIKETVRKDPKTFFIFMNIPEFDNHPNIKFLPSSYDLIEKSKFVDTCDYMIHARSGGETFGLAVSEFSLAGKPVITYGESGERAHIEMLGDYGITYSNPEELKDIFENTQKYLKYEDYSIPYLIFSPENVMKIFKDICLSNDNTNDDLTKYGLHYQTDKAYWHQYTKLYNKYFSKIRFNKNNILEIGIGTTNAPSIKMLSSYFETSNIFTIDIYNNLISEANKIKNVQAFLCDSSDKLKLYNLFKDKELNLIIDDGAHIDWHQKNCI